MSDPTGFTAAYCGDPQCPAGASGQDTSTVGPALAATVRRCPHGVLVRAGCLHAGGCGDREAGAGALVVVQPCDTGRRPRGPAVLAGPLHEHADVEELCVWLSAGLPAGEPLPVHLRPTHVVTGADRT